MNVLLVHQLYLLRSMHTRQHNYPCRWDFGSVPLLKGTANLVVLRLKKLAVVALWYFISIRNVRNGISIGSSTGISANGFRQLRNYSAWLGHAVLHRAETR
jgi:hypothetical protein